jgi:hypothetical protein
VNINVSISPHNKKGLPEKPTLIIMKRSLWEKIEGVRTRIASANPPNKMADAKNVNGGLSANDFKVRE